MMTMMMMMMMPTFAHSSPVNMALADTPEGGAGFIIIIITTRPKPAYGRQGLAGSWGQDTDEVSTFLVFLTSHFAPVAFSSDINQHGAINHDKNPPGIMKTRPGTIKTTKNYLEPRKINLEY